MLAVAINHQNDGSLGSGDGSDSGNEQRDTFRNGQDVRW
jgi:hypothetical protein